MTTRKDDACFSPPTGPSRRDILRTAAFLAGTLGLQGLPMFSGPASGALRQFTAGRFALELDGKFTEFLKTTEGGFPKADVVNEKIGSSPFVKKHIGSLRYQDIAIQCDPVMSKPLLDWVTATLNRSPLRKNGAILTTDFNLKEQSRLQFNNALITEIGFPACDGSSKEPGFLTIKFAPEFTTPLAGKGAALPVTAAKTTTWHLANFRLTIPGLDCKMVNKIDAFTIKNMIQESAVGQVRDYEKEPGRLEFPNLAIYLAESQAGTFYAWFQDMVIKGNAFEQNERTGTLEFLDQTRQAVLLTINFEHLGIFGFSPEKSEANAEQIRRVKVEMYCERITLTQPGKAA